MSVTKTLLQCKWLLEASNDHYKPNDHSLGIQVFLVKTWKCVRGRRLVSYQVLLLYAIAFRETLRMPDVSSAFRVIQILCVLNVTLGYVWVYSFYNAEIPLLVDDLLWVSRRIEPLSTKAIRRKCERIVTIAKLFFWAILMIAITLGTAMIVEAPLRSAFPVGHPFPQRDERAEKAAETLIAMGLFWESCVVFVVGLTAAYIDGLHCSGLLVMTSLLKMIREAVEECDFANEQGAGRILVRAHQKVLAVADRANQLLGTSVFLVFANTFVIGLATCYTASASKSSSPIFISFTLATGTSIFLAMISEILCQANEEIGDAIYGSDWTSGVFTTSKKSIVHFKFAIMMVQMRSMRPLCVQSRYIGRVGNAFIFQYFQRLYTCLQALLKLL